MGHFYLGQSLVGGILLFLGIGLAYVANNIALNLIPLAYGIWAIAGYHAYRSTGTAMRHQWAIVAVSGVMLLRVLVGYTPGWINQAVLQCVVPSESMRPTLQVEDRLFVSRNPYYRPEQGDIVVFLAPDAALQQLGSDPETLFVKRVIALPGDEIRVAQGQVWVNQQPVNEPYAAPADYTVAAQRVPPAAYFVLGDNRNASGDSHVWGFLPADNILGQAYKIY